MALSDLTDVFIMLVVKVDNVHLPNLNFGGNCFLLVALLSLVGVTVEDEYQPRS